MDPTTLAAVFINAQFAQVQPGARLKIAQMKSEEAAVLARTIVAIARKAIPISNLPHGIGQRLDVTL